MFVVPSGFVTTTLRGPGAVEAGAVSVAVIESPAAEIELTCTVKPEIASCAPWLMPVPAIWTLMGGSPAVICEGTIERSTTARGGGGGGAVVVGGVAAAAGRAGRTLSCSGGC